MLYLICTFRKEESCRFFPIDIRKNNCRIYKYYRESPFAPIEILGTNERRAAIEFVRTAPLIISSSVKALAHGAKFILDLVRGEGGDSGEHFIELVGRVWDWLVDWKD
jgi:hypothetical protein